MKIHYSKIQKRYDGSQLQPLFAYKNFSELGDSILSWQGPCSIAFDKMVDLEDVLDRSEIRGDLMLHFIIELFNPGLLAGVALQRLFASIVKDYIDKALIASGKVILTRHGDDLYWQEAKLSISICSVSSVSTMIHFAMNVVNSGTPVQTISLQDFNLNPEKLAEEVSRSFRDEYKSIVTATQKVKPL